MVEATSQYLNMRPRELSEMDDSGYVNRDRHSSRAIASGYYEQAISYLLLAREMIAEAVRHEEIGRGFDDRGLGDEISDIRTHVERLTR